MQPRWFDLPDWRMTLTALYDNDERREHLQQQPAGRLGAVDPAGDARLRSCCTASPTAASQVNPNSFPAGFSPDLIPIYSQPVRVAHAERDLSARHARRSGELRPRAPTTRSTSGLRRATLARRRTLAGCWRRTRPTTSFTTTGCLRARLRIGAETPYGSLGFIPLPERFFVGGSNSHRGFAINQAGPRDPVFGSAAGRQRDVRQQPGAEAAADAAALRGRQLELRALPRHWQRLWNGERDVEEPVAIQPARPGELPRHEPGGDAATSVICHRRWEPACAIALRLGRCGWTWATT